MRRSSYFNTHYKKEIIFLLFGHYHSANHPTTACIVDCQRIIACVIATAAIACISCIVTWQYVYMVTAIHTRIYVHAAIAKVGDHNSIFRTVCVGSNRTCPCAWSSRWPACLRTAVCTGIFGAPRCPAIAPVVAGRANAFVFYTGSSVLAGSASAFILITSYICYCSECRYY